jgi:hypothetical protein
MDTEHATPPDDLLEAFWTAARECFDTHGDHLMQIRLGEVGYSIGPIAEMVEKYPGQMPENLYSYLCLYAPPIERPPIILSLRADNACEDIITTLPAPA